MRKLSLPLGQLVPVLGQGTADMGEDHSKRKNEIEALRLGVDLGMTLIDTAELYGSGRAEELIAEALGDRRNEIFLVSKVLPHHATRHDTVKACEKSLERLKTDRLDLYLLHWPGSIPLEETLEAFQFLKKAGKILNYGLSNFDVEEMKLAKELKGGNEIATNQVLYNLNRRGIEWDLLPWCRKNKMPIMAYSPFEQGRLVEHPLLKKIASKFSVTPAQIALAWVIHQPGVLTIPKASRPEHVQENYDALKIKLTDEELKALDQAFPPPKKKNPLPML